MFTQWEDAYAYIVYIRIMTSLPGCRTIHRILWLEVFLDSRLQYESLAGLMDFLAFLIKTLWQNKQKLVKEIPINSPRNPYKVWGLSAITLAPEKPGSQSRPLNIHITGKNPTKVWATISAHCPGDDVTKNNEKKQNLPSFWPHPPKSQTQIPKVLFFSANYKTSPVFRGFE